MRIMKLSEILKSKKLQNDMIDYINQGKIFAYPTDTIYGLGCDATNSKSVKKIREIKKADHPFSVIPPSKDWIISNLVVDDVEYLMKLPGPFTLIFRKADTGLLQDTSPSLTLGVRIPHYPLIPLIQRSGKPFVTTSVNISGQKPIISVKELPKPIASKVDIVIDAGIFNNPPSTVIDYTGKEPRIIR